MTADSSSVRQQLVGGRLAHLFNESDAMTISRFFRDRLGAPLLDTSGSWGAISPSTGYVYLRVWDDELGTLNGRSCVRITDSVLPDPADPGDCERHAHVQEIERGAKTFCVILTAVDPQASPRKIKSFDGNALVVGGELIRDSEGRFWLANGGRCPIPPSDEQPRPASSRPLSEERPRLVKRVDRRVTGGRSDRPVHQEPSPAARPPGTCPGSRNEGRRVRETPLQSLHRTLDSPEGVFGARETRTDSARERHRARETALQLLYQWDVGRIGAGEIDDALDLFWTVHPAPAPRRELALGLARGAVSALPKIDLLIGRHTDNWRSERLAVVDRLIMRLAVYELLFEKTPAAVVINEALELAKTFSGERAVAFINGVLDAVRRAVAQQDEGSALGT